MAVRFHRSVIGGFVDCCIQLYINASPRGGWGLQVLAMEDGSLSFTSSGLLVTFRGRAGARLVDPGQNRPQQLTTKKKCTQAFRPH